MINSDLLNNDTRVIHFESMTRVPFVSHFMTTNYHDLGSQGFGYLRSPSLESIKTLKDLGLEGHFVAFSRQAHTDHIAVLNTLEDVETLNQSESFCDGMITQLVGVALWTVYADCTPVYAVDRVKGVIGLAHSGWRGTLNLIAPKMMRLMETHYGTDLKDLVIVIGPSIGVKHFEVGPEVASSFQEVFGDVEGLIDHSYSKPHVNVRAAIEASLIQMGIEKHQIERSNRCTFEETEVFYSYRRQGQEAGRMAAVLMRKE